ATALASFPWATRSARLSCSTPAARAGLRAAAPVLEARDFLTVPPLDFLATAPSAVVVMATPSGPQRRDTAGQCHWRIAALSLRPNLRPDRGCRHHPCRVIPTLQGDFDLAG